MGETVPTGSMTSLERLRAAVTLKEYDRPPFSDNEWPDFFSALVPYLAKCPVRADGRYSEEERVAAARASLDMVPWHETYASEGARYPLLGPIPQVEEGKRTVGADGIVRVIHNGVRWVEERPFSDLAGAIRHLQGMLRSARDAKPSLSEGFSEKLQYARSRLAGICIAFPYTPVGLDHLYPHFSWELFAGMTADAGDLIAEYLSVLADNTVASIHLMARQITAADCPVVLVYSDIAHNGGLLLSPAFLRQALLPAFRRIAAAYHEHGIMVVYHSEGDLRKMLPELIAAGADGINPVSPAENMDPVEIRRLYPDLILWGGIENATLLVRGSVEEVRREVHRVVEGVGRGLILGSSGGVHPACKVENCVAMVDTLNEIQRARKR